MVESKDVKVITELSEEQRIQNLEVKAPDNTAGLEVF